MEEYTVCAIWGRSSKYLQTLAVDTVGALYKEEELSEYVSGSCHSLPFFEIHVSLQVTAFRSHLICQEMSSVPDRD